MKSLNTHFALLLLTFFSFMSITACGSGDRSKGRTDQAGATVMTGSMLREIKSGAGLLSDELIKVEISPIILKRSAVMTLDNRENASLKILFTNKKGTVIKKVFTNSNEVNLERADFDKGQIAYHIYKSDKVVGLSLIHI